MSGFLLFWLVITYMIKSAAEDVTWAVKGEASPRVKAREARRLSDATGSKPVSNTHRSVRAVGDYVAGLIEDGTTKAKEAGRKRSAKHRTKHWGGRHVGTVFDATMGGWIVACDRCAWTSRPYFTEAEANAMVETHENNACEQK